MTGVPAVLVVDDRPDNRTVFAAMIHLHLPEVRVLQASGGTAALAMAATEKPDVVLADVGMPGMDGIELCRRLKSDPETSAIPVVLVTAQRVDGTERARGLNAGADEFLSRPVDNTELVAKLRVALRIRAAEDGLRASNVKLRERAQEQYRYLAHVLASVSEAIVSTDLDYLIRSWNRAAEEIYGWSEEEVIGKRFPEIVPAQFGVPVEETVEQLRRDGIWKGDVRHRRKDGSWILVHGSVSLMRDEAGVPVGIVAANRDITERIRMEETLRQTEKMTAIGRLAGGVAHDFNNQLSAILGYAEILAQEASEGELRGYAQSIVSAARRSAELTRQLLVFSRRSPTGTTTVDLHALVDELSTLLARSFDRRIEVRVEFPAAPAMVRGDADLLQNALLNLALNARDAMPEGGVLGFRAQDGKLDERFCSECGYSVRPGRYLRLSVSDTGRGMDEDVRRHLFEPFFTTKDVGKGTGLGLASVDGTVRALGGAIVVTSSPGAGTTFELYLPEVSGTETTDREPSGDAPAPVTGKGRILLVDDEEGVRSMAAASLVRLGYGVTACSSGREAVERFSREWSDVDLVLLDMIMPGMTGMDTYRALRAVNPALRVILTSGFAKAGEIEALEAEGAQGFLRKPYQLAELAQAVSRALSR
jgi:two-component system, cell cycle sensor histidine kinase and response regulator CckA